MTERFIKFIQVELNDFLGNYDDQKNSSTKKDEGIFDQIYNFFTGEDGDQTIDDTQDKNRAYQEYRKNRQSKNRSYNSSFKQPQNEEDKYYQALEVKRGASFEEIKQAYKNAIKKYHPDKFANDPKKQGYAIELSQKINEAYNYFKKKFGKS